METAPATYHHSTPTAEDYQVLQRKYDSALEVIEKMQTELRQLRRMIFGRRSERFVADRTAPGQLEMDFGDTGTRRPENTADAGRKIPLMPAPGCLRAGNRLRLRRHPVSRPRDLAASSTRHCR